MASLVSTAVTGTLTVSSGSTFSSWLKTTNYLYFDGATGRILLNTADAADTKVLYVGGGGDAGQGRGAYIGLYGNDHASSPGTLEMLSGTSGAVKIYSGGSERLTIANGGKVGINSTNPATILSLGGSLATGGIYINSGTDQDHTIIDMTGITGGGKLIWDDSEEAFSMSKDLTVSLSVTAGSTAVADHKGYFLADGSLDHQAGFIYRTATSNKEFILGAPWWAPLDDGSFHITMHHPGVSTTALMTVKQDGNVGIGTTVPSHPLHVYSTVGNASAILIDGSASNSGYLSFRQAGVEKAYIQYTANSYLRYSKAGGFHSFAQAVAIGTTAVGSYALYVNGTGYFGGPITTTANSGGRASVWKAYSSGYGVNIYQTNAGVDKWNIGLNSSNEFYIYNYAASAVALIFNTSSNATFAGSITVPSENNAAHPEIAFGDGDTGFYEASDDSMWYASAGVARWKSDSGYLLSTITTFKPTIVNEVATATNPAYTFYTDLDTGIGHAAANKLSLVAGGVGTATVTSTGVGIGTTNPGQLLEVGSSGDSEYALIGKTKVGGGMGHGNYAGFSHRSMGGTGNFALLQSAGGATYLNAASGSSIYFQNNNVTVLAMSGSGLTVGSNNVNTFGARCIFDLDYSAYNTHFKLTNASTYGLISFIENTTHKGFFGIGGSSQSHSATTSSYSASGFTWNLDGAGHMIIANRGSSKMIRLCTGTEGNANFDTVRIENGAINLRGVTTVDTTLNIDGATVWNINYPVLDYNLSFRPDPGYAGIRFNKAGGTTGSAGYLLIKDNSDALPTYSANGITLVGDTGHVNIVQRTSSTHGIRLCTGSAPVERLVIANDGNVGIGTTVPSSLLHVYGSGSYLLDVHQTAVNWAARIKNTSGGGYGLSIDTSSGPAANGVYSLACYTPVGSGVFVTNQARLGVGATSPDSLLHIEDDNTLGQHLLHLKGGGASGAYGMLVEAANGNDLFKIDTLSYKVTMPSGYPVGIGTASPTFPLHVKFNGAVAYNGATDLNGESILYLEGTSADQEASMIRWANHGNMNNYFGVVQEGATGQGDFVWTSYGGSTPAYAERLRLTSAGRLRLKSPTSVNGEQMGRIEWWNENGAGIMAKISCVREASPQAPGALAFYTSANVDTTNNSSEGSWSEKMRITSSGKVGIGTTAPARQLDVSTAGSCEVRITNSTDTKNLLLVSGNSSSTAYVSTLTSGENLRIQANGGDTIFGGGLSATTGGFTGVVTLGNNSRLNANPGSFWLNSSADVILFAQQASALFAVKTWNGSTQATRFQISGAGATATTAITGNATVSGTLDATGNFTTQGYVQHTGYLYSRDNLAVLNAAGTGWKAWATRSNSEFNLDVGTITSGALTGTTATFSGALTLNNAYLYTPASSYWRLGTTWNTGSMTWLNGVSVMGEMKALHLSWTAFRVGTGSTPSTGGYYLGNSYTGMYSITANTVGWIINNAEKMRLTYTGLGIGTTIPDTKLHISTTDGTSIIRLERNDSAITAGDSYGQLQWEGQDAGSGAGGVRASIEVKGFGAGTSGETAMFFRTSYVGTSRDIDAMMINHLGLVGIGTTAPSQALDVYGNVTVDAGGVIIEDTGEQLKFGDSNVAIDRNVNDIVLHGYNGHIFTRNAGETMRLNSSGSVGIGTISPLTPLHVKGSTGNPSTSANNGVFTLNSSNAVQLQFGSYPATPYGYWLQTKDNNNAGPYNYPLLLQPVNGNVGIGLANPDGRLEIAITPTVAATTVNETDDFADKFVISNAATSNFGDRIPLVFSVGGKGADSISAAIVGEREASGWNSALSFWVNNVTSGGEGVDAIQEAMRINSNGNVGIGTTAPAATLHVRDTTASTSRWTAAFVADNAAIVSAQAHDHVLIQSNDVPSLKLYEYGQDQVGGIAVGDNNCTIASTETLRFYVNGSATDNIYNGLAGTRALLLSTSGAATFVGSVTATTLTLSTGTITHGSTTILNSSRELMNIAELSINASTAGSNKLYCNGNANINGDCDASTFTGSGAALTSLNGSNISSGTVASARLGTGTASSTTYLAGNGTWSTPSGGGGGSGTVTSVSVGTGLDVSNGTTTPYITLDLNELSTAGTVSGTDDFVVIDGSSTRKEQMSTISLSGFSGYYGLINRIYKTSAGSSITPDSSGHVIMAEGTGVSLSYSGNTITFATGTSSDYRLKKNISNFNSNAWAKVKSVNLRKFDFDEDAFKIAIDSPDAEIVGVPKSYTDNVGFIAHELAEVGIEGSVIGEKDAVDADGNLLYQKINYIALVPALWGALNEAISKIETLESKVQALENK